MNILAACAAGAALAADACAVSVVCGASAEKKNVGAVSAALSFGLFQAVMPIVGWSVGALGSRMISGFEGIAAFAVLCFLGVKMMLDCFRPPEVMPGVGLRGLLLLSVATSVDAMTAGIALPAAVGATSFPGLLAACGIIGGITAVLSFIGYIAGSRATRHFPVAARLIGGAALTALGIKALIMG